jgi:penicillin-binding protein 2A
MRKYVWRTLFVAILALVASTGIALLVLVGTSSGFDPSKLEQIKGPTIVKDSEGQVVMKIQPPGPQDTPLSEIPLNLQHAVIAVEDARFYENNGIDFRALLRALYYDIIHRSAAQGASTIPEQLAKIVYLKDDKSISYKIKEIIYGIDIEKSFTKDQILDFYLNEVFLGQGATGVSEAARVYFDKPVSQLDLAECALLAGLPQAPSYYNPYVNKEAALERRNLVLKRMLDQNYITESQYEQAVREPIRLSQGSINDSVPPEFRYYRDYLYEEADRIGIGASVLAEGGVTVYTTLDPKLQKAAYDAYQHSSYFPPNMHGEMVQSGAVFLNPKTGGIKAIIGARGEYVARGLDHATQIHRSPGSAIKPLVVYGPAIATGRYSGDSLLYDDHGSYDVNGYVVHDWDGGKHTTVDGKLTLREALAQSYNVPAVWLLQQLGVDTGIRFAEKAGLAFSDVDYQHLGVALGDISKGTNPLQMADAYSSFVNNGQRIEAHAITQIVNADGSVIYDANPKTYDVMSPGVAHAMTALLENNVVNGIAKAARVPGWDVAGKTGSTQYEDTSGDTDVWFCGFTSNVVGAIWMGFDNTDANHYIPGWTGGSAMPARLFSVILRNGLSGSGQSLGIPVDSGPKPPAAIDSFTAAWDPVQHSVILSWPPVDQAANYQIARTDLGETTGQGGPSSGATNNPGTSPSGSMPNAEGTVIIQAGTGTTYQDPTALEGHTYTYQVRAYDDTGTLIAQSSAVTVVIPGPQVNPPPPTGSPPGGTPGTQPGPGSGTGTGNGGNPGSGSSSGSGGGSGSSGSGGNPGRGGGSGGGSGSGGSGGGLLPLHQGG